MFDADSGCWSDVDNFSPLHSLVKSYLSMKPDRTVESSHLGNERIAKIKMNLSKAMDNIRPSFCVSTRGALKKQVDNLMI